MSATHDSPMPLPRTIVSTARWKRSKITSRSASGTPGPSSSTSRNTARAAALDNAVLDQGDDLLRALEGKDGEVWPRRTLLMHVRATVPAPDGILFVENLDAFDAACLGEVPLPDTWWILYAAGFKGSSSRLLTKGAVRWFSEVETNRLTSAQLHQGLEQVNQGACEAAFWGGAGFCWHHHSSGIAPGHALHPGLEAGLFQVTGVV